MMSNVPCRYIDSIPSLRQLASEFAGSQWLAVDTEFVRDRTYFPKFCLLQLAANGTAACIDTLAIADLSALDDLFDDERIVKVFHSARQDLEILYRLRKRLPHPLFDTQIAAPFLGLPDQMGYSALVAEVLNIHIDKMHTRTDWSLRPLSSAQLKYAADDVIYLGLVYQALMEKLGTLGRVEWVEEETKRLEDPRLYDVPLDDAWLRISGAASLNAPQVAVIRALAAWRERLARHQDCPRNWLIKDELLLELAKQQPKSMDDLKLIRGLDDKTARRYGKALLQVLQETPPACQRDASPLRTKPSRDTYRSEALLDILTAFVRLRAAEHSINPAILASRKDLRELIESPTGNPLSHGWRKTLVGDDLLAMLAGRKSLTVTHHHIRLINHDD